MTKEARESKTQRWKLGLTLRNAHCRAHSVLRTHKGSTGNADGSIGDYFGATLAAAVWREKPLRITEGGRHGWELSA